MKKNILLFLAGCIIILIVLIVGRVSKRKVSVEEASPMIPQDSELSEMVEHKQTQAEEESLVEEGSLPPGEPLLN